MPASAKNRLRLPRLTSRDVRSASAMVCQPPLNHYDRIATHIFNCGDMPLEPLRGAGDAEQRGDDFFSWR